MGARACPFCLSARSSLFGERSGIWVRCSECRAVVRDLTPDEFSSLHGEAFEDDGFLESILATRGVVPNVRLWDQVGLSGQRVLEVGPGSGHLLAAARDAGRDVVGVEASEVHRSFIRRTWGIEELYEDLAALPAGATFDAVIAVNVLEHVYDVTTFLEGIRRVLAPTGACFVSTVNAQSAEAALLGPWWSMLKEHDHVSFASAAGLRVAATRAGLWVEKVWSSELPFELPVSALVAVRDWIRARRRPVQEGTEGATGTTGALTGRSRLARFYERTAAIDPTSRALAWLGRAATVKAVLRPQPSTSS